MAFTKNTVSTKRLRLGLKVLYVIDFSIDNCPKTAVFVVIFQVSLADKGHLLIVLTALSCKERSCQNQKGFSYGRRTLFCCLKSAFIIFSLLSDKCAQNLSHTHDAGPGQVLIIISLLTRSQVIETVKVL